MELPLLFFGSFSSSSVDIEEVSYYCTENDQDAQEFLCRLVSYGEYQSYQKDRSETKYLDFPNQVRSFTFQIQLALVQSRKKPVYDMSTSNRK